MKEIYFSYEEVSIAKTIETTTNVIQVGFLNRGTNSIVTLNGFQLFPQPPIGVISNAQINDFVFWLPIGVNEIDRTQYKVGFRKIDALQPALNSLFVWYKMTNLNK